MNTVPAPVSATEALAMLHAGMSYLAAADPTTLTTQTQAECLQGLEQADAIATAARCTATAPPPAPGNTPGSEPPDSVRPGRLRAHRPRVPGRHCW